MQFEMMNVLMSNPGRWFNYVDFMREFELIDETSRNRINRTMNKICFFEGVEMNSMPVDVGDGRVYIMRHVRFKNEKRRF